MSTLLAERSILLVEDNPGDARLIIELLRNTESGLTLRSAETLAAALEAIASEPTDAVLLDLGLPDSSGVETFTRLQEAAPRVTIIVLSGDSDPRTALLTVQGGAQDFLVKERLDGEVLTRSIGYAIERKASEWSLRESDERLRRNLSTTESIAEVSRALVSERRSIEEIAQLILDQAMALTGSPHGFVSRVDPSTGADVMQAATAMMPGGLAAAGPEARARTGARKAVTDRSHIDCRSLETGQPFMTNDPGSHVRPGGMSKSHAPMTSFLAVPVVTINGIIGQVAVANAPGGYATSDVRTLERLAALYGVVVVQREEHEELSQSEEDLRASNAQLTAMVREVAETMGSIIEARDPYTQGHQVRVARIAVAIATEMGLPGDGLACIEMAGLLHDIGKLSVPAEILSKPGALSEAEFAIIREHPARGHEILRKITFPCPIADIVLQHQERCDGSGYPSGLKREETLLEARILAVADVLEAMSSHRPYRAALGTDAAMAEIVDHPEKYDPDAVRAAIALHARSELGI